MRDITIGQYYASDSVIHHLDPRTKLFATLLYIILLFLVKNPLWYLFFAVTIGILYKAAQVPFGYLLKGLKGILLLLFFTFIFRLLCTPGTVIYQFWIFAITEEGITKAIQLTARIALMIVGASLLSYTSTPKELADGLEKSLQVFERKFRVPIHEMSIIVMIAFRFIPLLIEEINILMDAQAARGAEFEHCSVWTKCKNIASLMMPLFYSTVRRSADLAMAMEARGYRGDGSMTSRMHPLIYTKNDKRAYAIILSYFVVMVIIFVVSKYI